MGAEPRRPLGTIVVGGLLEDVRMILAQSTVARPKGVLSGLARA